jgi:hypothetical protein
MKLSDFRNIKKFKFEVGDQSTNDVRIRELEWLAPFLPEWGLKLEFGVFNGVTISCLATARPELKFHGFDSFEGLPEDWDCGEKMVKGEAFDRKGVLPEVPENVSLYKGWFNETLEPFAEEHTDKVSYLHLDADIYSSTKYVLDTLNDRIVPGTIIRLDELVCWRHAFKEASPKGKSNRVLYTTWKEHEWKALEEWMEENDRVVVPLCRNWFQGATVMVTQ